MNGNIVKKDSRNNITEKKKLDWIWFSIVFLFSLNFLGMSNYLLFALLLVGLLVGVYKDNSFKMTRDILFLGLFSFSYFLTINFYGGGGIGKMFTLMIGPLVTFFIGYCIVKFDNKFIFKTVIAIVFGNFVHGFLNMTLYFKSYGFTSSLATSRLVLPDIWTGESFAATLQGTFYTLMVCLLFFSLLWIFSKQTKKKILALLIFLSTFFSLLATFIMGNRTLIIIMVVSFSSNFLLYNILTIKKARFNRKLVLYIVTALFVLYISYTNNLFGVRDFVESSTWYLRTKTTSPNEDPRLLVYKRALSQMYDFPFGGYKMDLGLTYAHNLWIDVLHAAGLIPFFLLLLYTFKSLKNLIMFLKQSNINIEFKIFIFSIYTGFLLNFMVEPILEGVPYMFLLFCLINGMIRKQNDIYNKEEVNKFSKDTL